MMEILGGKIFGKVVPFDWKGYPLMENGEKIR